MTYYVVGYLVMALFFYGTLDEPDWRSNEPWWYPWLASAIWPITAPVRLGAFLRHWVSK